LFFRSSSFWNATMTLLCAVISSFCVSSSFYILLYIMLLSNSIVFSF
jgi:hypothetical protein